MRHSVVIPAVAVVVLGLTVAGCCCLGGDDQYAGPASAQGSSATGAGASFAQTTCPVMAGPVQEDIYVDHEGRRIYLCCEGCIAPFKKDPERYIAKLDSQLTR